MKWADAIKYVDRSPENSDYVNVEDLARHFDMSVFDDADEVFQSYWVRVWNCTDTWVGSRVLCVRGEPVGVIFQECRKCDETYQWISVESREKARAEILRLMIGGDQDIDIIDLDQELPDTYRLDYADQVVGKTAFLNGKEVALPAFLTSRSPIDQRVLVDGEEVMVTDLRFPTRVKIPVDNA
jgi:hypothetical protein